MKSLLTAALMAALFLGGCGGGGPAEAGKRVQDLSDSEKEALQSLLVKVYKEAFGVLGPGDELPVSGGYRTALFQPVTVYALPGSPEKNLAKPIESVSMVSGFVWDSPEEVEKKIADQVHGWSVKTDSVAAAGTMRILKYEVDYKPATPGMGSSMAIVTIVPLEVQLAGPK